MKKAGIILLIVITFISCATFPRQNEEALEHHLNAVIFRQYGRQQNPVTGESYFFNNILFAPGADKDVVCVVNGTVIDIKDHTEPNETYKEIYMGRGSCVAIETINNTIVIYGGISTTLQTGDRVTTSTVIGRTGSNPEPYTFHFAVIVDGTPVDPLSIKYDIPYFFKEFQ